MVTCFSPNIPGLIRQETPTFEKDAEDDFAVKLKAYGTWIEVQVRGVEPMGVRGWQTVKPQTQPNPKTSE